MPRYASKWYKLPAHSQSDTPFKFGALTERQNAVTLFQKLQANGYRPFIEDVYAHGRLFHRVRIGTFSPMQPAIELARTFKNRGIPCVTCGL